MSKDLKILYQDSEIIVVDKPAGLLTAPDRYDFAQPCLSRMLAEEFEKIFIVHRLDKETSGIIVFARTAESHRFLNILFQDTKIERIYHVIVSGNVLEEELTIDIPIMPHPAKKGIMTPSVRGKESITVFRVLERFRGATLAECKLITGRQHQIRVHCAAIGHALLVDKLYGSGDDFFVSSVKRRFKLKKATEERPILTRTSMHARTLEFIHPVSEQLMTFSSEYPKDFSAVIQILRKYSSIKIQKDYVRNSFV
ncbi:MAG: RluA family pseudouridine synthase [Candidatus Kapabacteria bacterium]|nr:RluA family pseudouridine synthase [Candidatus Kapabacteria bacterium]